MVSATVSSVADPETIATATERLRGAVPRGARVILFGSRGRGDARPGSDLDLLVIEPELENRRDERVRLRLALGWLGVPVDLIVISERQAGEWGDVPGTVIHEALKRGRVVLEG